jgi:hypothetical protein
MTPEEVHADPRWMPAVELLRRTGAREFQLRFSDDQDPLVWIALCRHGTENGRPIRKGGKTVWTAAAGLTPTAALFRLCDELIDGGTCQHCRRPSGFHAEPGAAPRVPGVCWYRWDPRSETFARSCGN